MSIIIKNMTVKNFMSIGNCSQAINFDRNDLTLVLGENLDLGGDGSRNGTGKTTAINALSYVMYGVAISNIRKDNLVNRTNNKNMLVSLDFLVNGQEYRIERGRKPNVLKFYVNDQEKVSSDNAQGDSRETQQDIERILGLSHDMFKHIVALNTYTEPFLSLRTNDQRVIIEQLLGITQLSERADRVKELSRTTKDAITQEEFRIRAVQEANKRIEEQIESLRKRQRMWNLKKTEDISGYERSLEDLSHVDIEVEIQSHRDLETYNNNIKDITEFSRSIKSLESENTKLNKVISKLRGEISHLDEHKCYACGQDIHDNKQEEIRSSKQLLLEETCGHVITNDELKEYTRLLSEAVVLGDKPEVFYGSLEDALNHRHTVESLKSKMISRIADVDPYYEQIEEMTGQALQEISYDALNDMTKLQEHQDFLLKLLTSKDSFIRKKIIQQNLSYLNARLTHYLDRIGLPHTVVFQDDLSVSIEELGREMDFDGLSRGERNRLILSLSWAFRDVYESLYHPINLLLVDEMIDNGLDTLGVENALSILKKMSRERNKSIWLVSHRDELTGRVENILKVVKESGFTSYSTDVEMM